MQYLLHFDSRPSKSGIKGGQGSVADYAEDFAAFTGAQGGGGIILMCVCEGTSKEARVVWRTIQRTLLLSRCLAA